jgi:hypothetical protein
MGVFRFVSTWTTTLPPEKCWPLLERSLRDGRIVWWPQVELRTGGEAAHRGIATGDPLRMRVRSPLGYRLDVLLRLTEVVPPHRLSAASTGDLEGEGSLDIRSTAGGAELVWTWTVAPRRPWMRATGRALRPVFSAAHTAVMHRGERGFRRLTGD